MCMFLPKIVLRSLGLLRFLSFRNNSFLVETADLEQIATWSDKDWFCNYSMSPKWYI